MEISHPPTTDEDANKNNYSSASPSQSIAVCTVSISHPDSKYLGILFLLEITTFTMKIITFNAFTGTVLASF